MGRYRQKQIWGLVVISTVLLMGNIDTNILNVAIPAMSIIFKESIFTMKLAVTSYLIGMAMFIPISGWMSDRLGAKTTLKISIILFTVTSTLCGCTHTLWYLVFFRLLQGASAAFMLPVGRVLLFKIFEKKDLVRAYTIMSIPALIGPIIAPILGGYIVTYCHWNYIFWINIPVGIFCWIVTYFAIENYTKIKTPFALVNFVFLSLFLACFTLYFNLIISSVHQVSLEMVLLLMTITLGWVTYKLEKTSTLPVVRWTLFNYRTFRNCFLNSLIIRASLGGRAFILAIYFEVIFNYSPLQAGIIFIWVAIGMLLGRVGLNRLLYTFGFKMTMTVANIGSTVSLLLLTQINQLNLYLLAVLLINGYFSSAQFLSVNILYYDEVKKEEYSSAVSIAMTWQQIGMAFGVVIAVGGLDIFSRAGISMVAFHKTFFLLAILNILTQYFIWKLHKKDGETMMEKKLAKS